MNNEWPQLPNLPGEILAKLAKCLALVPDRKLKPENAACVMGGKPPLPESVAWPSREGKLMTYVGRINTTVAHELLDEIPAAGWLLFFHDPEYEVIQTLVVTDALGEEQEPPEGVPYLEVDSRCGPFDGEVSEAAACNLVPAWSHTYDPDTDLDDAAEKALTKLMPRDAIGQLLGRVCFEEEYSIEQARRIAANHGHREKNWRLLLSFDSVLDYCWSDSGSVRYFIGESKLAKGEFDHVVSDVESG